MEPVLPFSRERAQAIRDLELLDSPAPPSIAELTRFAAETLNTSMAMISLIDEDRQYIYSSSGIDLEGTSLEDSFCVHCLATGSPLLVADLRNDVRFAENPHVMGAPNVRSYLGVPVSDPAGLIIGTLCVMSRRKAAFSTSDIARLKTLAVAIEGLIALQARNLELGAVNRQLNACAQRLKRDDFIFRQAESVAGMGVWQVVLDTQELYWSEVVYRIHGHPMDEPISVESAIEFYEEEYRETVNEALVQATETGAPFQFEADIRRPDGEIRRVRSVGELVELEGESDRLLGIFADITEEHQTYLKLKHAADHDSLTGCLNRSAFDARLASQLAGFDPCRGPLHVLLLDLDGFKDVNDFAGHLVGDVVLEETAARIMSAVDGNFTLARWGGDEFALILPQGVDDQEAMRIAQRLVEKIGADIAVGGAKIRIGATCGIAGCKERQTVRELLRRADLALYDAKRRQKGSVSAYDDELENQARHRQAAVQSVEKAVRENDLLACYQPIVDLTGGATVGLEALLRIRQASGVRINASQVLPALIDPILSRKIFDGMLDNICRDYAKLTRRLPDLEFVSINATEADLLMRGFSKSMLAKLHEYGIDPKTIVLEVTETLLLVNDTKRVKKVLDSLRASGMSIALDDFGTGFSSLAHLKEFPIDKIKLDKSFVSEMTTQPEALMILQAMIAMGRNMKLEIVAEGVETGQQRQILADLGCQFGQGFLFSHAVSVDELSAAA